MEGWEYTRCTDVGVMTSSPIIGIFAHRGQGTGMVDESVTFGLALAGTIAGLVVMLYGVSLTSGESLTVYTIVGGVIVLLAIMYHTYGIMALGDSGSSH